MTPTPPAKRRPRRRKRTNTERGLPAGPARTPRTSTKPSWWGRQKEKEACHDA